MANLENLLYQHSSELRKRLKEILLEKSLRFAPPGEPFVLSSGQTSEYYIDGKKTTTDAEGLFCVSSLILDHVKKFQADAIGGPTLGADPISAGVSMLSHIHGKPMASYLVRKSVKDHGTRNRIEGTTIKGKRVIVVEDVITTGGSVLSAIQAIREAGADILEMICIVDREQGATELLSKGDLRFTSLFRISELLEAAGR